MQCTYKCSADAFRKNHCCRGKAVSIVYSESVFVALVIQHAKLMLRIILSSVACAVLPYYIIICGLCGSTVLLSSVACAVLPIILSSVACAVLPYYIIICGLCGSTVLCYHLWPVRFYRIFPQDFINFTIFGEKFTELKTLCFKFLYNFCLKRCAF